MKPDIFHYDAAMCARVGERIVPASPQTDDRDRPLASLAALLHWPWPDAGPTPDIPAPAFAYYALMSYRDFAPGFFPAHDLCLLMGNSMARQMADDASAPLVLLDWGLLPVAALLAGAGRAPGRRFFLPPAGMEEKEAATLVAALGRHLPGVDWQTAPAVDAPMPAGAWLLAQEPLAHCARDARFLERLEGIAGGVLAANWDFLGVRIHAYTRSRWLEAGLPDRILQLPRPRRQGATGYPAILTLRPPRPGGPLRLAQVSACRPGPGSLDQEACLDLLYGAPRAGASMDVDAAALARDGLFTLTPATWLDPGIRAPQGRTLRNFAQVLRCQLARERLTEAELGPDGEEFGETTDGRFIAREVSLSERDPMTGFVDEYRGTPVRVALNPLGKQGKYLLQPNDIIFAFRGTALSVGQVGFVEDEGRPAITGQSMCIIRALPDMDPVWLYYYLQRERIARFIRSRASGANLLTVNLESIRDIPVVIPDREEIEAINLEHRKISENMALVARLRRESAGSLWKIRDVGDAWEKIRELDDPQARGQRKPIRDRPEG